MLFCVGGFNVFGPLYAYIIKYTPQNSFSQVLYARDGMDAERNITINKLATLSALPPSSVKNILYGRSQDPKILTIKKICDGLEITLIDFFNSPEFESLEPEIK